MKNTSESHCSREQSRIVRQYLEREVFSKLPFKPSDLPQSCQLNPSLDIFAHQEVHKIRDRTLSAGAEWKCGYCKKMFKNEKYMDRHMDKMHQDKLIDASSSVCLADLCPIFGCQQKIDNSYSKSRPDSFQNIGLCREKDVEKVKYRCELLMKRYSKLFLLQN